MKTVNTIVGLVLVGLVVVCVFFLRDKAHELQSLSMVHAKPYYKAICVYKNVDIFHYKGDLDVLLEKRTDSWRLDIRDNEKKVVSTLFLPIEADCLTIYGTVPSDTTLTP